MVGIIWMVPHLPRIEDNEYHSLKVFQEKSIEIQKLYVQSTHFQPAKWIEWKEYTL